MMSDDFNALIDKAMQMDGRNHMRPVIEKELLHYDILFALDKEGLLDKLTFQGGTLLRLCYGSHRFSEDLDFVGGKDFNKTDLVKIKNCVEKYIGERYGFEVSVKEPKELAAEVINQNIKVEKWQVSVTTSVIRNMPKQKIKIEVINVPAYTHVVKTLQKNYDFLPDGYSDIFIPCETLDEVYADKIIAFINTEKYIRHRDIWDLHWIKQQGVALRLDLVKNKINDYDIKNFSEKLDHMLSRLKDIVYSDDFRMQMSRFIPIDVQERTLKKDKFYAVLMNELMALFQNVKQAL